MLNRFFAAAIFVLFAQHSLAEVLEQNPNGFTSQHELMLEGSPERVFTALTAEVNRWWDAAHSYGGKASAFTMDLRPGGCFCEALTSGGFVAHMHVVNVQPGRQLTLAGGLGPLQNMGVAGSMVFLLEPVDEDKGEQTRLRYRYEVGGYTQGGLENLAGPVDQVQLGQLTRLKQYLETGVPLN